MDNAGADPREKHGNPDKHAVPKRTEGAAARQPGTLAPLPPEQPTDAPRVTGRREHKSEPVDPQRVRRPLVGLGVDGLTRLKHEFGPSEP